MTTQSTGSPADSTDQAVHGLFIDGEWRASASGRTYEKRDPANVRSSLGSFARGDASDIDAAVEAARNAKSGWRSVPAPRRGEILFRFAGLLAEAKESIARTVTQEMGKVIEESRGDVQEAIDLAYLYAGEGRRLFGETAPSELPDKWSMSVREPVGVVAIITPWNVPVAIPALKLMPALISGNAVVWKPASDTPGCAAAIVRLMSEAGVPDGVLNLVTGSGEEAGMHLVEHPGVDAIAFTGSSDVGRRIAEVAGRNLKRVSLELGGKNAIAIMADADLDLAVESIIWAAFGTTGQRCTACSRLVVVDSVADALLERLSDRVTRLRLGHGLEPETDVGPLVNKSALDKFDRYLELAERNGRVVCGGAAVSDDSLSSGYFAAPTVVDHVRSDDPLAQDEIFGPLLSVIRVADYAEAASAVNSTSYGLSSGIFTNDLALAFRALHDFETGLVYVNGGTIGAETQLPFGGTRDTGNGHRDSGSVGLDNFTEWKTVYVDYSGRLQRAQIDNQPSIE